ncbi:ankyrin repeat domain-containing protein [Pendulispora albinea]|uniref:Ankyrin repeat domain-containing protein n=1 Tax=Pendulispora albinea TaxID=2741071 RepID=A0ABZ2LWS2_9BACT
MSHPTSILAPDEPRAAAVVQAIRAGDVPTLKELLRANPDLATARVGTVGGSCTAARSLLHIATDWPGHLPNGAATVRALVEAGADVNARFVGDHTETPLHWAASNDDVEVLDALIDLGADIEARGAIIAGGTPISDATAFGQWKAARRLIERGARTTFWEASALGLEERVEAFFRGSTPPTAQEVTEALWGACHGGQPKVAEYLLARGAELNWVGWDGLTALEAAQREGHADLAAWLRDQGAKTAAEIEVAPAGQTNHRA